jgi:hypothetical protein
VWHIEQLLAHRIAQRWVNGAPPRYDAPVTVTDMTCFPLATANRTRLTHEPNRSPAGTSDQ